MLITTTAAMITTRVKMTTPITAPIVSSLSSELESFLGITFSVTIPSFWSGRDESGKITGPLQKQRCKILKIYELSIYLDSPNY